MRRRLFILALLCCSTQAMAADPCDLMQGNSLHINVNGSPGVIGPNGITFFGSFFTSTFQGSQDGVVGSCANGVLNFSRIHQGVTQHFVGLFLLGNSQKAAGVFTDTSNKAMTFPWSAEVVILSSSSGPSSSQACLNQCGAEQTACINGAAPNEKPACVQEFKACKACCADPKKCQ